MPQTSLDKHSLDAGFDAAADTYDVLVALNPGYRRHLRSAAEALLDRVSTDSPTLLDLGCGSGLSTRELLAACRRRGMTPRIVGVDASAGMLAHARRRDWPAGVEFRHGSATELDALGLPAADGVLACYLLRNVPDLDLTLRQVVAALRPGGALVAEDYSIRGSRAAARRWHLVNRAIVLPLARLVNGDVELYRYLHASVDTFATMPELAAHAHAAGLERVESRTVPGWQRDILHILRASRPAEATG